jgi:hypothetical protein
LAGCFYGMVCDEVRLVEPSVSDLPNVVVDDDKGRKGGGVAICGSRRWSQLGDLASLFVGILSHESIHLALIKTVGPDPSDRLDEVASLSALSARLADIRLVRRFAHGLIGIELI